MASDQASVGSEKDLMEVVEELLKDESDLKFAQVRSSGSSSSFSLPSFDDPVYVEPTFETHPHLFMLRARLVVNKVCCRWVNLSPVRISSFKERSHDQAMNETRIQNSLFPNHQR